MRGGYISFLAQKKSQLLFFFLYQLLMCMSIVMISVKSQNKEYWCKFRSTLWGFYQSLGKSSALTSSLQYLRFHQYPQRDSNIQGQNLNQGIPSSIFASKLNPPESDDPISETKCTFSGALAHFVIYELKIDCCKDPVSRPEIMLMVWCLIFVQDTSQLFLKNLIEAADLMHYKQSLLNSSY